MFKKAAQMKLRFRTAIGNLSVEDLWDLKVESDDDDDVTLKSIYVSLARKASLTNDNVPFGTGGKTDKTLQLQLDIVNAIAITKETEAAERDLAVERRARKQRLLKILADKQDEDLRGMSVEELQAEIDAL